MSARSVAVLDRKIRLIEDAVSARIESRCDSLRLDLALAIPPRGPFTRHSGLVDLVSAATDDVAVSIENGLRMAYDESWKAIDRDLRGILATTGRRDLNLTIRSQLRRPGILEQWVGEASTGVTITETAVLAEAARVAEATAEAAGQVADDWSTRLIAPGRVGVIGRRGRSLFASYPGLLRGPLIDVLWAFINADRTNFGNVVQEHLASAG